MTIPTSLRPAPAPPRVRCRGCGEHGLTDLLRMADQPTLVGELFPTESAARRAPTGDIDLAFCHHCGLVHNRSFDADAARFAPGYEVSLSHTPTFASYIDTLARRLVGRYRLQGRRVLEIGCGDGYFLRQLARHGIGAAIGVDPTLSGDGHERYGSTQVTWKKAFFDPATYEGPLPDFVACLSVFESIDRPAAFLRDLRTMLAGSRTPVYLEVFNAGRAFQQGETWSIHYEQCNYFDLATLTGLFERSGFDILDTGHSYGGDQYIYVEAEPSSSPPSPTALGLRPLPRALEDFASEHARAVESWRRRLADLEGKRVALWGSGGKAFSLLNTVPGADAVRVVADINPDRQGRHIPAGGQLIVSPEELVDTDPDVIVITNPLYGPEIRAQAARLGLTGEFLAA